MNNIMDKIRKYIDRFGQSVKMNDKYDITAAEWLALTQEISMDKSGAIHTAFSFGYAKGYRAAMAEMKKGGTV